MSGAAARPRRAPCPRTASPATRWAATMKALASSPPPLPNCCYRSAMVADGVARSATRPTLICPAASPDRRRCSGCYSSWSTAPVTCFFFVSTIIVEEKGKRRRIFELVDRCLKREGVYIYVYIIHVVRLHLYVQVYLLILAVSVGIYIGICITRSIVSENDFIFVDFVCVYVCVSLCSN